MATLLGSQVRLRAPERSDIATLVAIRTTPEVYARWRGGADLRAAVHADLVEPGATAYVIETAGRVVGWIQWSAEAEPDYRFAIVRHLIADHGHRRFEIDPAADNQPAIRCYTKVGFRPVGIRRGYERGPDDTWHDALLMDLLAEEFLDGPD
jgi:aminoglycoside 6'-N-acetyltransferase